MPDCARGSQNVTHTAFVAALIAKVDYLQDMVAMYELELGRLRAERDTLAAKCRIYEQPAAGADITAPIKVLIAN